MVPFSSVMERAAEGPLPISSFVPPAPVTDRVACAIRTLSKPDTVSAAENWGDRDPAWPAIAAQLRDTVGVADRATVLATAALALRQVNGVIAAVRDQENPSDPPSALNATLEFDLQAGSVVARYWARHPLCSC